MIKQIQLRGISRTPSDRMSEDGGLSESLNMYMDTAESAPAFVPEDVTAGIGLPADISADRIFVHKTANYENYIVVQQGRVVAYTPDVKDDVEPVEVMSLLGGEKVNDITSVGNTLVVSTSANMYFSLFENRKYRFLGNKIPFPCIHFDIELQDAKEEIYEGVFNLSGDADTVNQNWQYLAFPSEADWNAAYNNEEEPEINRGKFATAVYNTIINTQAIAERDRLLSDMLTIRYAVKMYDGSYVSSMPILLSPFYEEFTFKVDQAVITEIGQSYTSTRDIADQIDDKTVRTKVTIPYVPKGYKVSARLVEGEEDFDAWAELITSVDIFVSKRTSPNVEDRASSYIANLVTEQRSEKRNDTISGITYDTTITTYDNRFDITVGSKKDHGTRSAAYTDMMAASAHAYIYKSIASLNEDKTKTKEFTELCNGMELDLYEFYVENQTPGEDGNTPLLETREWLQKDDMKHYPLASKSLDSYNNRVLLVNSSQTIEYDYDRLNSVVVKPNFPAETGHTCELEVIYILQAYTEDKVIRKSFTIEEQKNGRSCVYPFQVFPDNRARRMMVKVTKRKGGAEVYTKYGDFKMEAHPYLDCAVTALPMRRDLIELCTLDILEGFEDYPTNTTDDLDNKLLVSSADDPFVFPLEGRFTFQSKVLGVAVANTALSQGQFGQFPLYVFTEDGIWAMETAADGSFVTSKPLSREVCTNPDSITSIDNAVVFVTKKAVMMISGSQVANISAYMNGRHYVPNESAQNVIRKQEGFSGFIPAVTDEDPFMQFMQDAKVAYDYAGQRLIFISPSNKDFQYVYKIDTQTWHKIAFEGFDLVQPLNSFPECLIRGVVERNFPEIYCTENSSSLDPYELLEKYGSYFGMDLTYLEQFLLYGERVPLYGVEENEIAALQASMQEDGIRTEVDLGTRETTCVYDLSTVLDASRTQDTAKGILITRPFDLGMPDVYKSITEIKIRGDYDKGNVRWLLQGSDNGRDFYTLTSLRGKSWKMFRIFILADLEPTERLSWIDIDFEPRYNNRLR